MLKMQSALLLLLIPALCPAAQDVQPKQKSDQNLPPPFASKSVKKFPKVVGWDKDRKPNAAKGFTVTAYLRGIENPRWIYVLENGDVLVALSKTVPEPKAPKDPEKEEGMKKSKTVGKSPDRIMLLRDAEGDGKPEVIETFLKGLNRPFGMALHNDKLFVANTDGVMIFPYTLGQKSIEVPGKKIIDLPAGGYNQHWTRNLLINPKTQKLFISVGSASNVGEHGMNEEKHRANILESNLDGSDLRVFASGLRNPVGMDWEPTTGVLWTAVNERDELGDDLVPDYLT